MPSKKQIFDHIQKMKGKKTEYMPDGKTPKCFYCGSAMVSAKENSNLWKCTCNDWPKGISLGV
jgi:tRNA(Ile2) C34 agmatinyltransferase TiaS